MGWTPLLTLIEKSSTVLPLCPPKLVFDPPSRSDIRERSCATCRSCSSNCVRCCSTFSCAILYNKTNQLHSARPPPIIEDDDDGDDEDAQSWSEHIGTDRRKRCLAAAVVVVVVLAQAVADRQERSAGTPSLVESWFASKESQKGGRWIMREVATSSLPQVGDGVCIRESDSCQKGVAVPEVRAGNNAICEAFWVVYGTT